MCVCWDVFLTSFSFLLTPCSKSRLSMVLCVRVALLCSSCCRDLVLLNMCLCLLYAHLSFVSPKKLTGTTTYQVYFTHGGRTLLFLSSACVFIQSYWFSVSYMELQSAKLVVCFSLCMSVNCELWTVNTANKYFKLLNVPVEEYI